MKQTLARSLLIVAAAATLLYAGLIHPLHLFEVPILKTQDLFFRIGALISGPPAALNDFVLIAVDDESINRLEEKWPFKRRVYADFLEKLASQEPKLVAFDFLFSGKSDQVNDFLLSLTIRKVGNVVLATFVDADGRYLTARKMIAESARSGGVVNKLLDRDITVRRTNLIYRDERGDHVGWPWEIEILAGHLGLDREEIAFDEEGIYVKQEAGEIQYLAEFSKEQKARINYRFRLHDVPQIPFWQALQTEGIEDRVKGKTVVVGSTSQALHDYYATPLGFMPGVVVNLNLLLTLATKDFLRPLSPLTEALFVFLFVVFGALVGFTCDPIQGLKRMLVATTLLSVAFIVLFLNRYVGDFFTPVVFGWLVFVGVVFRQAFFTLMENVHLRGKVITDPLTGLYNRRMMESKIEGELEKLVQTKGGRRTDPFDEVCLLMLDVDNFKHINDSYGHQFGDDVLRNVAFSLKENIRGADLAVRYGGEEFCVVLPHTNKRQAVQIAEKIRKHVADQRLSYINKVVKFTLSIGVAAAREDDLNDLRSLIEAADSALYLSKQGGKNKVTSYRPVTGL